MKKLLTLVFIAACINTTAQNSSLLPRDSAEGYKTRRGIWFIPNAVNRVNGLAVDVQAMNVNSDSLEINGINASAGMLTFFMLPYLIDWQLTGNNARRKETQGKLDLNPDSSAALSGITVIRGLSLSFGGEIGVSVHGINIAGGITAGRNLYGLSVTGYFTKVVSFKGICISGVQNIAEKGTGLQIGLFNKCKNLKGLQIGLWNKSGKRGLPFLNWGFR